MNSLFKIAVALAADPASPVSPANPTSPLSPANPASPTNPANPATGQWDAASIMWLVIVMVGMFVVWMWLRKKLIGSMNNRPNGNGLGSQFTRGSSTTRKIDPTDVSAKSFNDVAGCEEAIKRLKRVKRWLKDPGIFKVFGARLPKGILLVGPPGTGKTLLAKALAGEAGAAFFSTSGSNFVEVYVGLGASRVRDLFQEARNEVQRTGRPVIIFIDEIDAVGKKRSSGGPGSNDERDQTLNQILVEMDGFAPNQGIIVVAATNRADILDAALKRPGRFDYQVQVDLPDMAGRQAIFAVHMRGKPVLAGIDMKLLASRTPGFSGADIEGAANEAATLAGERVDALINDLLAKKMAEIAKAKYTPEQQALALQKWRTEELPKLLKPHLGITLEEFDEAIDIVQMGDARVSRSKAISKADMLQTAYHEAGHAAVQMERGGDPVTKITIMPRMNALGYTQSLPENDRFNMTVEQIETRVIMAMGGRAAQVRFCKGTVDTGASNDFEQTARLVKAMIVKFGMSELGPISLSDEDLASFGGTNFIGPKLQDRINDIWTEKLKAYMAEAEACVDRNAVKIERLVKRLIEKETLLAPEIRALWDGTDPEYANAAGSATAQSGGATGTTASAGQPAVTPEAPKADGDAKSADAQAPAPDATTDEADGSADVAAPKS